MSNPEFEPDILESIDTSGFSEKQSALQVDTKDTVRQQVKQTNSLKGVIALPKAKKKSEVIFSK